MDINRAQNLTIEQATTASIFTDHGGGLFPGSDRDAFVKNVNLLNERVNSITKELTYWDLYNLTQAAYTDEELATKQAALAPGESLVVNFDSSQNAEYFRGDVITRLTNGTLIHVPAATAGYYFPKQIIQPGDVTGNYILKYAFSSNLPVAGSTATIDVEQAEEVTSIAETIQFEKVHAATPGAAYNIFADCTGDFVIPAINSSSTGYQPDPDNYPNIFLLVPLVRFFIPGGDQGDEYQEISLHYKMYCTASGDSYQWNIHLAHTSGPNVYLPPNLKIWAR